MAIDRQFSSCLRPEQRRMISAVPALKRDNRPAGAFIPPKIILYLKE
jgi:hypothetical protein